MYVCDSKMGVLRYMCVYLLYMHITCILVLSHQFTCVYVHIDNIPTYIHPYRLLCHQANITPQPTHVYLAHINVIQRQTAANGVIETLNQRNHSALAAAARANKRCFLVRVRREGDPT